MEYLECIFGTTDPPRERTDSGEDGGGEEDGLEVVPVVRVVLAHQVHAGGGGPLRGHLVAPQQQINVLV